MGDGYKPGKILELKTVIIGDTDVGKTSISMRFCHGKSPDGVSPTIGASFMQKRMTVEKTEVVLQLWDTAGQERFRSMAPMYYRGAKAAILVFDLTQPPTFSKMESWRAEFVQYAGEGVVMAIAGNKADKDHDFDLQGARDYASALGIPVFQTSAYSGLGIDALFYNIAKRAVKLYNTDAVSRREWEGIVLNEMGEDEEKRCWC
mmetsp:Transcript_23213/g.33737  ORF Transcript_23213/g.33737 Transcript_23213/m.33737 type:complete len:204 (-) Transcript_23213:173-784(-)|eukprot:CAMPEP_0113947496 /NCGR_PEP_ID=MMETSP1339-20121228/65174_1 /TAXON_ID=94617 /ORGANISM="Fibrocapsa japonica" /LENGTH=203 /DNA_ID=CAMNT_0000954137 /DNA_START=52 /DNA_END=663 /DNA_ORIENTATION=- /assembly_acc=CAM_ASM_000762